MSENRIPDHLAEALRQGTFGYLVSLGRSGRAHVGVASARQVGERLVVAEVGGTTRGNLAVDRRATVVLPPAESTGYTLIVDGHAVPEGAEYLITVARAVLHRHGCGEQNGASDGCAADCVELALPSQSR